MTKNEKMLLVAVLALALFLYQKKLLGFAAVKEAAMQGDPTNDLGDRSTATADVAMTPAEKATRGNRTQSM